MLGPNDEPCCLDKPLGAAGSLTYSVNEDDARDDFGDTFIAGLLRRDLAGGRPRDPADRACQARTP